MSQKQVLEVTKEKIAGGPSRKTRQRGFTLVEVMVAVVIVGIGISAAMYGLTSSMTTSHEGRGILVAGILAGYVKQYSDDLAFSDPDGTGIFGPETGEGGIADYDDVDDLDGSTLQPPIGADGSVLDSFPNWSQVISVNRLDPDTFEVLMVAVDTPVIRVEVEIRDGGRLVGQYQWIVTRR